MTLDEERRRMGDIPLRHGSRARKERYNEAPEWVIVDGLEVDVSAEIRDGSGTDVSVIRYGTDLRNTAVIRHHNFAIDFQRNGKTQMIFNHRGVLNIEHWRAEVEGGGFVAEDQSTWWDESFGSNIDTKPKGPESIALDISFPGYKHVFGIPEHTGPLSLRETR